MVNCNERPQNGTNDDLGSDGGPFLLLVPLGTAPMQGAELNAGLLAPGCRDKPARKPSATKLWNNEPK